MKQIIQLIFVGFILVSCARVGSPVGGDKDTLAPRVLGSNIDTPRVNVPRDLRELRIQFDEYITLKDIQKNLIISPPLTKIKKILPSNLATKEILIQWQDTLQANTTYSFNFGSSIQDYNEGNTLPYYNFAFSTGEKIDDTYISGEVNLAGAITKTDAKVNRVVGLYQQKDSIDYRQKPYYITRADEDGYYELNYLTPGTYQIIAFEDENGNSIYDVGKEKIAFQKEAVVLEKSISGLNLTLYPSQKPLKYLEMKENPGGIVMLFEGNPEKVEVLSLNEKLKDYKITHRPKSDSVKIWFDAVKQNLGATSENLKFSYNADAKKDTVSLFYKRNAQNEMTLVNEGGNLLPPGSELKLKSNYYINQIQPEKWKLTLDSLTVVPFSAKISETNGYQILVKADFQEGKKYKLNIPKETVSSFYDAIKKTHQWNIEADKIQNYGSFKVKLINKPVSKFWIQLLNSSEKVIYEQYTSATEIKFPVLKPDEYFVRILVDNNGNGNWDGADFTQRKFAEDVYIFHKKINIRPLWTLEEDWDLKDKRKLDLQKPATSSPAKPTEATQPNRNNLPNINQNRDGNLIRTAEPIRR